MLKNICEMTEAQFRQHWIAKVFRADTAVAPKIVYSSEMAADLVNRMPGAITFVDRPARRSRSNSSEDRRPAPGLSHGYPLR